MTVLQELGDRFVIARFRDGDTLEGYLHCTSCGAVQYCVVRLLGIESWEPAGPTKARAQLTAQRLTERYQGTEGMLLLAGRKRDKYARMCADLIVHERSLAAQIVELGEAWHGVGKPEPVRQG